MRIAPIIAAAALPPLLGACAAPDPLSQQELSRRAIADLLDDASCRSRHLHTGTAPYKACRKRLAAKRGDSYRTIP